MTTDANPSDRPESGEEPDRNPPSPSNRAVRVEGRRLDDPTTRFPKPPYKKQSQSWPRLAGKMEPWPDHGEKSFRGSNRLKGRRALVTGGDSGVGRAAAIAFAREGADVAINYLPVEEPDAREKIALIAEGRVSFALPGATGQVYGAAGGGEQPWLD